MLFIVLFVLLFRSVKFASSQKRTKVVEEEIIEEPDEKRSKIENIPTSIASIDTKKPLTEYKKPTALVSKQKTLLKGLVKVNSSTKQEDKSAQCSVKNDEKSSSALSLLGAYSDSDDSE